MKIDLDEMEVSLGYLDDWKQLIIELRAAREVCKAARYSIDLRRKDGEFMSFSEMEGDPETVEALKKYDEARRVLL